MEIYKDSNGFPFSNKLVYRRKISELNHKFCQKNISIIIWIHITHVHMCINYFLWAYDYVSSFWINAQQRLPMPSSRAFPPESQNTHQRHELRQLFELIFFLNLRYIYIFNSIAASPRIKVIEVLVTDLVN